MAMAPVADPTNVFGRRVVAALIDGAIVLVPGIAIASTQFEYTDISDTGRSGTDYCDDYIDQIGGFCTNIGDTVYYSDDAGGGADFAIIGLALAMFVVLQGLTGWTVGKLIVGLRTVKEDGSTVGIGKAFVRWLLWIVDGLPCIPLVGFITALTSTGHRRVGDMAAKTFVVAKEAAGQPVAVPGLTAPPAYGAYPPPAMPGYPSVAPPGAPGVPPPPGAPGAPAWPTPPPPVAPPMFPTPTATTGPQWDEARGTYIQWDPAQSAWMQWDDTTKAWVPIR
jgi:uncharacterized RDD family membrane protein YckC